MKKMKFGSIIWGLLFIAAAGVIVLNVFGLLGAINTWTLLVSIPIAAGVIYSATKMAWEGMFLLLALLTFIYRGHIESAFDVRISIWALLGIALLLAVGFKIIFGKRKNKKWYHMGFGFDSDDDCDEEYDTESADGEKIWFKGKFTGSSKYITSENLSYVSIKNSFGGMEVYFENATLSPNGAVVDIENEFGGLELYIPRDWNVVNNISNFAAGTDCPKFSSDDGAPKITLRGSNRFGGIDVIRVK